MGTPLRLLSFLLLPFAWVYGGIVRALNMLYNYHFFESYQAPIPVICVGNLRVGGTGKTPQVEYIARVVQPKKIAILSRGYKRKTSGFVLADSQASALTIGDEPYQYLLNLPQVVVAVCEKRAQGIKNLLRLHPDLEVILLDDAFQHRAVKASANLLLSDYAQLFTEDYLLPAGRLREPRNGARRADAVVITKCPKTLTKRQQEGIQQQVKKYTQAHTPIFFSKIVYGSAVPIGSPEPLGKKLILVTGIANAKPMVDYLLEAGYSIIHHFEEPDHASYSIEKIKEIVHHWQSREKEGLSILMTQKDAVKWQNPELRMVWQSAPVFYLPITVAFEPSVPTFNELLLTWAHKAG